MVKHSTANRKVAGSNPPCHKRFFSGVDSALPSKMSRCVFHTASFGGDVKQLVRFVAEMPETLN